MNSFFPTANGQLGRAEVSRAHSRSKRTIVQKKQEKQGSGGDAPERLPPSLPIRGRERLRVSELWVSLISPNRRPAATIRDVLQGRPRRELIVEKPCSVRRRAGKSCCHGVGNYVARRTMPLAARWVTALIKRLSSPCRGASRLVDRSRWTEPHR